jgi:carboxymethylenebutenolidase
MDPRIIAHIEDVARRLALKASPRWRPTRSHASAVRQPMRMRRVSGSAGWTAQTLCATTSLIGYLKARADAAGPVGAVGFCCGGGMVNLVAVNAPDLDAAVVFYGLVPAASEASKVKARLQLLLRR